MSMQEELEKIKQEKSITKRNARRNLAKQGRFSGCPPRGYNSDGSINSEASMIRSIFNIVLELENIKDARLLITNKYNINKESLNYILRNKTYTGKVKFEDKWYEGNHEPLVSEEDFGKIKNIIDNKEKGDMENEEY